MITCENNVFHIKTDTYSYMLRINDHGIPEHLHFGAPVRSEDWEAFLCRPGIGWGSCVLLEDSDTASCLDDKALEWSGCGRGDYRESPLELGGVPSDFRFEGYAVAEGTVPMGLPQAHGALETLALTFTQPSAKLTLYYTAFPTALTRRTVLENTGDTPMDVTKCMSFSLDLPGSYTMATFNGSWIAEMRRHDVPIGGSKVVNESLTGASSNRHNPGFLLFEPDATEERGRVYGFNLVYSGNHYAAAQQSLQGLTRVMQGINPSNFRRTLAPGEAFETPEAVLCCSDAGLGGLSERMHTFVNNHIIPAYWKNRPRPVLYNSWEGCMFDFTQRRLLDLADRAKDLGCELFVLDDGWFGQRNHDKAGLGDYNVNLKKLPDGMEGLSRRIREKGLQFGLWFEPESVNPDSDLYRAHPDWALTDSFPNVLGRHQLLLDLTRPEVRDYIVENVGKILDSAKISYVKWDMNRSISECYSSALPPERQGEVFHRYILGVYELCERLSAEFPHILFESCSSGGGRFDPGMLSYAPQAWASDNTDAVERLYIQYGTSFCYPISSIGAHVSAVPNHQMFRTTPLSTRANVAYFGTFGYELDLGKLSDEELSEIKEQVKFMKRYRELLQFGDLYRLVSPFEGNTAAWMVVSADKRQAIVAYYRILNKYNDAFTRLHLRGLDPDMLYRELGRDTLHHGDELMRAGLIASDSTAGEVLAGIKPSSDFASRLYILEAAEL